MKISIFRYYTVIFTILAFVLPSFSFAEKIESKTFSLSSNNWQINQSNCDSWYDFNVDTAFNLPGWQSSGPATRIYGLMSDHTACNGLLTINNETNGMYSLFSYDEAKKTWQKINSSYQNIGQSIDNKPRTYIFASAAIGVGAKTYGDFSVNNSAFYYQQERLIAPTTTMSVVGGFSLATSTATSTISWPDALKNRYQLAVADNANKLVLLPMKLDSVKGMATTQVGPRDNVPNFYVINLPKTDLGVATWYSYKKCDCAASRDFPKGTKLKVTNLFAGSNFGKSIIVKVNDYGPMEYTGNLIDLDKVVFKKIGNISTGIMPVRIEVVK